MARLLLFASTTTLQRILRPERVGAGVGFTLLPCFQRFLAVISPCHESFPPPSLLACSLSSACARMVTVFPSIQHFMLPSRSASAEIARFHLRLLWDEGKPLPYWLHRSFSLSYCDHAGTMASRIEKSPSHLKKRTNGLSPRTAKASLLAPAYNNDLIR